jgi:predicted metal-dependent phosphoesterase TrpH
LNQEPKFKNQEARIKNQESKIENPKIKNQIKNQKSKIKTVIDLHLHTTASDGLCSPRDLVHQCVAAGLTTIAVTDHDTTAAVAEVQALCGEEGLDCIAGIEITAIENGVDVHVLGYFLDPRSAPLASFLARQRQHRVARVKATAERLAALGIAIDVGPLIEAAARDDGRSIGRPQIARALVASGHAVDSNDAFDRWLARGRPGFVPRSGAPPEEVIGIIHEAGGLASLAHPGQLGLDGRIPALRAAGLDAIEAYHSDHDPLTRDRYVTMARSLGLLVTGGSDFHGDPAHGLTPGTVTLPRDEWERLSTWPRRS